MIILHDFNAFMADAASTVMLLIAIQALCPGKRVIHSFLDNAQCQKKRAQTRLTRPEC